MEAACSVHFILKLGLTFLGLVDLLLIKADIVYYADSLHSERNALIRQDLKIFQTVFPLYVTVALKNFKGLIN